MEQSKKVSSPASKDGAGLISRQCTSGIVAPWAAEKKGTACGPHTKLRSHLRKRALRQISWGSGRGGGAFDPAAT